MRQTMSALAILSCRPNSHPFQERHISLHEPVKIGRSVARARPSGSNGIFDCKVLSRHHAMLWYEAGKVSSSFDCLCWRDCTVFIVCFLAFLQTYLFLIVFSVM